MNKQFYVSVWRWHFFAGLYVVPFILMLSLTGLLMLVSPWTDNWQYGNKLIRVGVPVSPSAMRTTAASQLATVIQAYPNLVAAQYVPPIERNQSSVFKMRGENFATLLVFVNPYTGEILGDFKGADRWYSIADEIHGTLMIGNLGDLLIELSAGLMIFLVFSGLYLHWPRNRNSVKEMLLPDFFLQLFRPEFLLPRNVRGLLRKKQVSRTTWKAIHSSLGFYLTLFILFFALTGLAWTGVWGQQFVQPYSSFPKDKSASAWASDVNAYVDATHGSLNDGQLNEIPWNLEQVALPQSTISNNDNSVGLDQIVDQGLGLNFPLSENNRFRVALPLNSTGVYTLMSIASSRDVVNPMNDRTLHIDQYSSEVLADITWQDYNLGAKAMALGIPLHKGTLGLWNIILASIVCLLLIFLSVSGVVLWWRRKPSGEFGIPRAGALANIERSEKAIIVIGFIIAIAFPITGIAMALFGLLEVCLSVKSKRMS